MKTNNHLSLPCRAWHTWSQSGVPRLLKILALAFLSPLMGMGATLPGTAPVVAPAGGFGIDGELLANTPTAGIGDWVTNRAGAGGFILNLDGTPVNPGTTFHVLDPYNSAGDNVFSGGKYDQDPNTTWQWKAGSASSKVDINNAVVHITTATNGHQWAVVSGDRLSGNGDAYIDFEFLQDALTLTPTNALGLGGFTNAAPNGGRRVNDFILTLAFTGGGDVAEFYVQQWKTNAAGGGFDYATINVATSLPPNSVFAAVNPTDGTLVPYGAFGGTTYGPNTFAEAAVDLTALVGAAFDPCAKVGIRTILVKTKQSPSPSAALGDLITPVIVDLTLGLADAGQSQTKCSEGAATPFLLTGAAHPNVNGVAAMSWSVVSSTSGAKIVSPTSCTNCLSLPVVVQVTNAPATALLRLSVTDIAGCTVSDDVVLTVNAPTTLAGPANQSACRGGTATFSAVASGSGPFGFQWLRNGSPLAGATNSSLVLSNVGVADAGAYCLEATGNCGRLTNCATLTVNESIVVTGPPVSLTKCPGATAAFSVTATGTALSYQWFKGASALNGESGSTLSLTNVSAAAAGIYSVQISGACGAPLTLNAALTVNESVVITSPPASLTKCPGATAVLSVTATGTDVSYQWFKGVSVLSGATSSTLTLTNVGAADAGIYSVQISGACGEAVTNSATLTVNESLVVTSPPASLTKCPGETATFNVGATGTGVSYQWFKGASALSGATSSTLTLTNVSTADAGSYNVQVSGACGGPLTLKATLTVNESLVVTSPPASLTKCPGATATFNVGATGTALSYQWFKGVSALSGATSSTLSLTNVSAVDAGTYSVQVSGACGEPLTNSATLAVNENVVVTSPPTSLTKCPGATATFNVGATGTGVSYQWFKGASALGGKTSSTLTLTNVSAADAGIYGVQVSGACGEPLMLNATLMVNESLVVTSPLVSLTKCPGATATFNVGATGTGVSYQWFKGASALSGKTSSTLTLTNVSATDAGSYSVQVSGACGGPLTLIATLTVNESLVVTSPPASLTKCPGATATFNVGATGTALSYQWFKGASALGGKTSSTLTLTNVSAADAGSYSVQVSGACGGPLTLNATLTVNESLVVISPPVSLTKCPGATATFNVGATGTGVSYQWFKGASVLNGATSNTLTLTNVSAADAGSYSVQVSGACGGPLTLNATLTVNESVAVTSPPASLTKCPGTTAAFNVGATGTGVSYQWFKGASALNGATSNTLTLTNVSAADAGSYSVQVSGACGEPLTLNATLTLNETVVVTSPPASLTKCPGETATFNVGATGTALSYQWFKGVSALSGATSSTLSLTNVGAADAGTYSVQVIGACGEPVTNSATLTVNESVVVSTPLVSLTKCPGATATFNVGATGTALSYQWFKGASALSGKTSSTLSLTNVSAADAGSYSVQVSGACGEPLTSSATLTVNESLFVTSPPVSLTKCPGATATFNVGATGTGVSYQWFKGVSALSGATSITLTLTNVSAADAGSYSVQVNGACGGPLTLNATLTVNESVIVTSPLASLTKCPGETATFNVGAAGTGVSYQWFKGVSALSGNTSSSLTLTNVSAADADGYSVQVAGACGEPVTSSATLTVNEPVTLEPLASQTACVGGPISFNAVAHGTGPFTYVWIKKGKVLPGATSNLLVLTNTTALDAGLYNVVVSGACTAATNSATLTLNAPTTATPLTGQTNCFGKSAGFVTTAGGTGPFSYVWTKDGVVLAGQTAAALTIEKLTAGAAGIYTVEVTGQCGSVSRSAPLAVESDGLTSPTTFANTTPILIPDFSPASLYPAAIEVSCVPKPLTAVSVTLSNVSHSYASDLDIILLSPSGRALSLMCDAGAQYPLTNGVLVFKDTAASFVPELAPIISGSYKPTNYTDYYMDQFGDPGNLPLPAPQELNATTLAELNGTDANGIWSLFVVDDAMVDEGIINGGWSLTLNWEPVITPPELILPAAQDGGCFHAVLCGQAGNTYVLEASSDMINWVPVSTNTLIDASTQVTDLESVKFARRFYRVACRP